MRQRVFVEIIVKCAMQRNRRERRDQGSTRRQASPGWSWVDSNESCGALPEVACAKAVRPSQGNRT